MCGTGAIYLDDCPAQYLLPIYLLVAGVVTVWLDMSFILQSSCKQKDEHYEFQWPSCSRFLCCSDFIVGIFVLAWFICGELCRP